MPVLDKNKRLKKELSLLDVYAITTGSTVAGGFFILPGLAAGITGTSLIFSYIIAALLLIPSILSKIELSTAMPRAGGVYYFLDRSLGPMVGTIGGIGVWLVLILKVAFTLVGMGAYIALFLPDIEFLPISLLIAVILTVINFTGARRSGKFQIFLVTGLLIILFVFVIDGVPQIEYSRLETIFDFEPSNVMAAAGLVFISYVGITKIASLSEEIKDPERNIPLGVFLALGTAFIVYAIGTLVMVGVVPFDKLANSLTPAALASEILAGKIGVIVISLAAFLSFISVANAGILSASRYPLAMSRDHIMPGLFRRLTKNGTPSYSLFVTSGLIILSLVIFDPTKIAKLASTFQLLMFALISTAVIVMRESKIQSYDPGYRSPLYPWMQILGIIASLYLIIQMGWLPILFTLALVSFGITWYLYYAKDKVIRNGAIYHIFERLGKQRYQGLDTELRGILKEKGLRQGDPFDEIIMRSKVIEIHEHSDFDSVVKQVAEYLEKILPLSSKEIIQQIMDGTKVGATPVTRGVALPHFRCENIDHPEIVLVRAKEKIRIGIYNPLSHEEESQDEVIAVFFLVSPEKDPTQHLRILAQIAGRVDEETFLSEWMNAKDEVELKESLLHDDSSLSLYVAEETKTEIMIGRSLKDLKLPEGALVALLRRGGDLIVPKGNTVLEANDRLTIIGEKSSIDELRKKYFDSNKDWKT